MTEKISQPLEKVVSKPKIYLIKTESTMIVGRDVKAIELTKEVEDKITQRVIDTTLRPYIQHSHVTEMRVKDAIEEVFKELKKLEGLK